MGSWRIQRSRSSANATSRAVMCRPDPLISPAGMQRTPWKLRHHERRFRVKWDDKIQVPKRAVGSFSRAGGLAGEHVVMMVEPVLAVAAMIAGITLRNT